MLCFICCDAEASCALSLTHYSLQPGGLYVPFELQPPVSQADRRKPPWNAHPHAELIVKKSPLLDCFQDDFFQAFGDLNWSASLPGFSVPQRLFRPIRCISILLFCSTGIISTGWMHLYLAFLFHRDYFNRPDASLSGSFAPQGLFRPPGFISIWLFCSTKIISTARIHLYLALLLLRDYFAPV